MDLLSTGNAERIEIRALQIGGALFLLLLWTFLGPESLLNSDDVIYAQMARESLESGQFLEHSWMGVTLFEKPPLLFWLLQLSGSLFGFADAAMRLPAAIGATVTVVYTYKLTRLLTQREGETHWHWPALSCLILLGSLTFTQMGGRVMTDTLLAAAVVASATYALRVVREEGRAPIVLLGLSAGLGFMAKSFALGPAMLGIVLFLLWQKRVRALILAGLVGLLVALPWHLFMTLRHGSEFWDVTLGYHVLGRAQGIGVAQEDASFYLTELFGLDPLVSTLFLAGFVAAFFVAKHRRDPNAALVLAMAALGLLVIHISATKLLHYVVPTLPLLAVATAYAASALSKKTVVVPLMVLFLLGSVLLSVTSEGHPSSRPELKRLAQRHITEAPPDTRVICVNEYAPSLFYYGEKRGEIITDSERFYAIQQSIDMMRRSGVVHLASKATLRELLSEKRPMIIVAPHIAFSDPLQEARANRRSRLLLGWLHHFRSAGRSFELRREEDHMVAWIPGAP